MGTLDDPLIRLNLLKKVDEVPILKWYKSLLTIWIGIQFTEQVRTAVDFYYSR